MQSPTSHTVFFFYIIILFQPNWLTKFFCFVTMGRKPDYCGLSKLQDIIRRFLFQDNLYIAQSICSLTIMDFLAIYLVVNEGQITPATDYVKNTSKTPLIKRGSLVAIGKDICKKVSTRNEISL